MRKASIAEWILSLATTPERAATTVGDLLEKSSSFWFSAVGTFVSLVIDGLVSGPARVIGVALVGFPAQYLLFHLFYTLRPVSPVSPNENALINIASCFWLVLIGYLFSRVLRERALPACFVLAILNGVFVALMILEKGWAGVNVWWFPIWLLPYLAGVVLSRRRYLHKHA